MLGGKNTQSHGYTIVETLIFLAVSGMMFIMAAYFVDGKYEQVQFRTDVRTFSAAIAKVSNDASDGRYPSNSILKCNTGAQTLVQGTNNSCIFLGETFFVDKSLASGANTFATKSIAGVRLSGALDVGTLEAASPSFLGGSEVKGQSLGSLNIVQMCEVLANAPFTHSESYAFAALLNLNGDVPAAGHDQSGAETRAALYGYSPSFVAGLVGGPLTSQLHSLASPNGYLLSTVDIYVSDTKKFADIHIDGNNGFSVSTRYIDSSAVPAAGAC